MALKTLIFDFDGTICDSIDLMMDTWNTIAEEYSVGKILLEERAGVRDLTTEQLIKKLGVTWWKLPFFVRRMRKEITSQIPQLKPIQGMVDLLQELKAQNINMGLLTSNSQENVQQFLQKYSIDLFSFEHFGSSLFGKSRILKKMRTSLDFPSNSNQVIYVGDETRDVSAAKNAGLSVAAVTWGSDSSILLEKYKPNYLVHTPQDLLTLV